MVLSARIPEGTASGPRPRGHTIDKTADVTAWLLVPVVPRCPGASSAPVYRWAWYLVPGYVLPGNCRPGPGTMLPSNVLECPTGLLCGGDVGRAWPSYQLPLARWP